MLRPFHAEYPAFLPRQEGLYTLALICRNLDRDRFQSLGFIPASRTAKSLSFSPWLELLTAAVSAEALDPFPGWGGFGPSLVGFFKRCGLCHFKHLLVCLTSFPEISSRNSCPEDVNPGRFCVRNLHLDIP